jgi:hypothetical protein
MSVLHTVKADRMSGRIFLSGQRRQRQRNQRQQYAGQEGLELYPARLSAHLRQFIGILNFFLPAGQLARTSRRQTYSSLVAPLKETHRRAPEK